MEALIFTAVLVGAGAIAGIMWARNKAAKKGTNSTPAGSRRAGDRRLEDDA